MNVWKCFQETHKQCYELKDVGGMNVWNCFQGTHKQCYELKDVGGMNVWNCFQITQGLFIIGFRFSFRGRNNREYQTWRRVY